MGKYRLTTDAKNDLSTIREYTKNNWGIEQSRKYIIGLRETLNLLSDNPLIGIQRNDIEEGIYSFSYSSHVIYYMLNQKQVLVMGVLHDSMVPVNHLENR